VHSGVPGQVRIAQFFFERCDVFKIDVVDDALVQVVSFGILRKNFLHANLPILVCMGDFIDQVGQL
jgi:hypothetical protein